MAVMLVKPVIFPPGRARLVTNPEPTGSPTDTMTIGIADVAPRAAITEGVAHAMMTSTLALTSSAATAEFCSKVPCGQRTSWTGFVPRYSRVHDPHGKRSTWQTSEARPRALQRGP